MRWWRFELYKKTWNFLACWGTVSFPARTLLHAVSKILINGNIGVLCRFEDYSGLVSIWCDMRVTHYGCNPRERTGADDSHMVWHSNELRRTATSKHGVVVRWNKYSNQCSSVWRAGLLLIIYTELGTEMEKLTGLLTAISLEHAFNTIVALCIVNTLRTGLLNCLNARSRGLTFRHRASCI